MLSRVKSKLYNMCASIEGTAVKIGLTIPTGCLEINTETL